MRLSRKSSLSECLELFADTSNRRYNKSTFPTDVVIVHQKVTGTIYPNTLENRNKVILKILKI